MAGGGVGIDGSGDVSLGVDVAGGGGDSVGDGVSGGVGGMAARSGA
jgi:hypothetical protein